jgi:hypothetical protein
MEPDEILAELGYPGPLPVEALRAAGQKRQVVAPVLIGAIEQYVQEGTSSADSLLLAFHLLGEWRETSAYRTLARLLRLPPEVVNDVLGDAITDTIQSVMAAVFDGDPGPLYDVILDPAADEYVRARMFSALVILTRGNLLSREEIKRFFVACDEQLLPRRDCYVWSGWQEAISALGLAELKPLVERAFADERINPFWLKLADFENDLRWALDYPSRPPRRAHRGQYDLFSDTIGTFSRWYGFTPEYVEAEARRKAGADPLLSRQVPVANPFKGVGRNDPCPCGSGKKFKRCCLERQAASLSESSFS